MHYYNCVHRLIPLLLYEMAKIKFLTDVFYKHMIIIKELNNMFFVPISK